MKKSLNSRLRSLKDHPAAGGMSPEVEARIRARIREAIGESVATPSNASMLLQFMSWRAAQSISRPVVASVFSLLMVAGGWMTTVRAADSLPGDGLYSVKMMTEKAQLKLASLDQRAVLHTKFAERRLQEAAELQAAAEQQPERAPLVKETLEASKQEIASAQEDLKSLQQTKNAQTLAAAASVQQNLQNLEPRIDGVVADSSSVEATADALAVREVTREANDTVADVVVEVHEEQRSEVSAREVTDLFKTTLGKIEARERFDLQRIERIRTLLADDTISYKGFAIPTDDEIAAHEYTVLAVEDALSGAMDIFATGGYRTAFNTLRELDAQLLAVESDLASIESMITQARSQTPPVTEGSEM